MCRLVMILKFSDNLLFRRSLNSGMATCGSSILRNDTESCVHLLFFFFFFFFFFSNFAKFR